MYTEKTLSLSKRPKKRYETPAFQIYGTLAQLTAAVSSGQGAVDSHPSNMRNTYL